MESKNILENNRWKNKQPENLEKGSSNLEPHRPDIGRTKTFIWKSFKEKCRQKMLKLRFIYFKNHENYSENTQQN